MMFLRILYWGGMAACIVLVISCFLPWVYYDDIHQSFTGFYSYQNEYGKPGKFMLPIAAIVLLLMVLPKLWAKRVNLFLCALLVAYAFKSFVLFNSCYNNYCPQKLTGIYLMLFSSIFMLIASVFPDVKIIQKKHSPSA